tara:strand:+ start:12051 stop:12341 length:291 start_codon:yes stop_codon:yes gene_type:complete
MNDNHTVGSITWSPDYKATRQRELEAYRQTEIRMLNAENNVVTAIEQLVSWTVTGMTRHKPGVVKYTATRKTPNGHEHITGYCKDEVFSTYQLPKE